MFSIFKKCPRCSSGCIFVFVLKNVKRHLKNRLKRVLILLSIFGKRKIIIGAASTTYENWVPTNIEELDITLSKDWKNFLWFMKLKAVLMEHVLEHLTQEQAKEGLKNLHSYLKTGGYVRIAVPDGLHIDKEYIEKVKPNGTGSGSEDHKILYNYKTLSKVMNEVGFECDLLEYWDEKKEFHYKEWDPQDGMIMRSIRFDKRNVGGEPVYTSLIIDGYKR